MTTRRKPKAERQAWWASLSEEEKAAQVEKWTAQRQARQQASPSPARREAIARLALATERGCFMSDITDKDVQQWLHRKEEQ